MLCSNVPFHFRVFLFLVNLSILAVPKADSIECTQRSIQCGEITMLENSGDFNFLEFLVSQDNLNGLHKWCHRWPLQLKNY